MHIELTKEESEALYDLSVKQELTPNQIIRQALRMYQAVTLGTAQLTFTNLPKKSDGTH